MNFENSAIDPAALVKAWANEEAELNNRIAVAEWFRELEYQNHLARLDTELEGMRAIRAEREKTIRAQLAAYVAETGELLRDVDGVTVRRVHPLRYDKNEARAWAEENAPHLLRRPPVELDVRKFEAALNNGQIKWAGAEQTNEVQIALNKLGHLVDQPSNPDESDKAK